MSLTQMRSVLRHHPEEDGDDVVVFFNGTPHDEDDLPTRVVEFLTVDWEDMGRPKTITVTIVPGDHLNEGR